MKRIIILALLTLSSCTNKNEHIYIQCKDIIGLEAPTEVKDAWFNKYSIWIERLDGTKVTLSIGNQCIRTIKESK